MNDFESFTNHRFRRWVDASHTLAVFEPMMVPLMQGLCKLEIKLADEDKAYEDSTEPTSLKEADKLLDRVTMSHLWVLGAYEVVRALDQRTQSQPIICKDELIEQIKQTKHQFARLRMPLAKMEPANKYKTTDAPIAWPHLIKGMGIGWQVANNVFITRQELADSLLDLLEALKTAQKQP